MKYLVAVLFLALSLTASTQTFSVKGGKGGFDTSTGIDKGESVKVDGKTFSLLETESGSRFIECLSARTGNNYPVWVGEETGLVFDDDGTRPVYQSRSGTYSILKISSKTGNPYAVYLNAE